MPPDTAFKRAVDQCGPGVALPGNCRSAAQLGRSMSLETPWK